MIDKELGRISVARYRRYVEALAYLLSKDAHLIIVSFSAAGKLSKVQVHLLCLLHLFVVEDGVLNWLVGASEVSGRLLLYADVSLRVEGASRIVDQEVTSLFFCLLFGYTLLELACLMEPWVEGQPVRRLLKLVSRGLRILLNLLPHLFLLLLLVLLVHNVERVTLIVGLPRELGGPGMRSIVPVRQAPEVQIAIPSLDSLRSLQPLLFLFVGALILYVLEFLLSRSDRSGAVRPVLGFASARAFSL